MPDTRRRLAGLLAGALLLLALGVGAAGPASAHDQLVGSDPADGAVLQLAPSAVVLTFNADQLPVGAAVVVRDASGTDRADGAPEVAGPTVTQALQRDLPAGSYAVQWRSVSGDGHPVEGTFAFELRTDSAPGAADDAVAPSATGTEAPQGAVTAGDATDDATQTTTQDVAEDPAESAPGSVVPVLGAVLVGVLLLAVAVSTAVVRARRRQGAEPGEGRS
ncbi:MAG: copper resistance protein CopC [Actinotalea sp.]|nr:copper resistance protein CopC [Actinotalea sp.]